MSLHMGRYSAKDHSGDPVWGTWLEAIKARYSQHSQLNASDSARLINEVYRLREHLWELRGEPQCPNCGTTEGLVVIRTAPPPMSPSDGSVFFTHPPCDRPFIGRAPEDYEPSRRDRI